MHKHDRQTTGVIGFGTKETFEDSDVD